MTLLNGLVPGTGASQRVGMKITIRSIGLSLVALVTGGTGVDQYNRWILLLDRQCNGAAPTALTDFLATGDTLGLRNLAARHRFKTVMDKRYYLNASGEPYAAKLFKVYMKLRRPLVVEYNTGNAGTVADIVTNSLYLISIGSIAAGAAAGFLQGYCRIRYLDN